MARITWQLFLVGCVFLQSYTQAQPLERIVNGKFAKPKQFPYQVFLELKDFKMKSYSCGGAIISDRLILTAAHCVIDKIQVQIYFGAVNINNIYEVGQQRVIVKHENIRVHEYYDDKFFFNDIALIKLANRLLFNEYIQLAKLPEPNNDYSNEAVLVPGWGRTDYSNTESPKQLMYLEGRILSPEACRNKFFQSDFFEESWICTMSDNSTQCSGDSGGAVVVPNTDRSVTLVGVNSFIISDDQEHCIQGLPAVVTRVSYYLDWIERADSSLN